MNIKTLKDITLDGKRVLVRVDFNVPIENGQIIDDTRIRAALPTISYLIGRGARIILVSHLGRPKGEVKEDLRLDLLAQRLSDLLGLEVLKADTAVSSEVAEAVSQLKKGDILMLENIRFYPGEESNDPDFARQLASLADVFVNDAFGTSHRAHASTTGVADYLPTVAGLLMAKEIDMLSRVLEKPARPFVAIIGGAKVSDKIGVIRNLLDRVDSLVIGGGMANTFLAAQGIEMGDSLVEKDKLKLARDLIKMAEKKGVELLLPLDLVLADSFSASAKSRTVDASEGVASGWQALDIGPKSCELFSKKIVAAATVVWNGPMGVFEFDAFAAGTDAVAAALAASESFSLVGGGDSVAALEKLGQTAAVDHISTGGGASLEYLEGKVLPGISVLRGDN